MDSSQKEIGKVFLLLDLKKIQIKIYPNKNKNKNINRNNSNNSNNNNNNNNKNNNQINYHNDMTMGNYIDLHNSKENNNYKSIKVTLSQCEVSTPFNNDTDIKITILQNTFLEFILSFSDSNNCSKFLNHFLLFKYKDTFLKDIKIIHKKGINKSNKEIEKKGNKIEKKRERGIKSKKEREREREREKEKKKTQEKKKMGKGKEKEKEKKKKKETEKKMEKGKEKERKKKNLEKQKQKEIKKEKGGLTKEKKNNIKYNNKKNKNLETSEIKIIKKKPLKTYQNLLRFNKKNPHNKTFLIRVLEKKNPQKYPHGMIYFDQQKFILSTKSWIKTFSYDEIKIYQHSSQRRVLRLLKITDKKPFLLMVFPSINIINLFNKKYKNKISFDGSYYGIKKSEANIIQMPQKANTKPTSDSDSGPDQKINLNSEPSTDSDIDTGSSTSSVSSNSSSEDHLSKKQNNNLGKGIEIEKEIEKEKEKEKEIEKEDEIEKNNIQDKNEKENAKEKNHSIKANSQTQDFAIDDQDEFEVQFLRKNQVIGEGTIYFIDYDEIIVIDTKGKENSFKFTTQISLLSSKKDDKLRLNFGPINYIFRFTEQYKKDIFIEKFKNGILTIQQKEDEEMGEQANDNYSDTDTDNNRTADHEESKDESREDESAEGEDESGEGEEEGNERELNEEESNYFNRQSLDRESLKFEIIFKNQDEQITTTGITNFDLKNNTFLIKSIENNETLFSIEINEKLQLLTDPNKPATIILKFAINESLIIKFKSSEEKFQFMQILQTAISIKYPMFNIQCRFSKQSTDSVDSTIICKPDHFQIISNDYEKNINLPYSDLKLLSNDKKPFVLLLTNPVKYLLITFRQLNEKEKIQNYFIAKKEELTQIKNSDDQSNNSGTEYSPNSYSESSGSGSNSENSDLASNDNYGSGTDSSSGLGLGSGSGSGSGSSSSSVSDSNSNSDSGSENEKQLNNKFQVNIKKSSKYEIPIDFETKIWIENGKLFIELQDQSVIEEIISKSVKLFSKNGLEKLTKLTLDENNIFIFQFHSIEDQTYFTELAFQARYD
ncbi:e3 ubiquitin-protein ligase rbbp6 [Anaeramoeba flamelloides]|uniref:E3 ubiquitin-protein ligase rbbp6 n=1 Tax=Anaeramoeba flamelloides TaxID=1746091 RepID=A0AAV8A1Y8_9EUKA|nr:e3 ubiquitin-protein ligase rbbp6 [Anaeramoeba flamelloides]